MALGLGYFSSVGFGEESTWGTAVSRTHWYRLVSSNLRRRTVKIQRPVLGEDSSGMALKHLLVQHMVEGRVVLLVGLEGLGLLLKHALWGTPATTGTNPYTHTYKLGSSQPAGGLTVELIHGNASAEVFEGCRINRLVLRGASGGFVQIEMDIIGETSGGLTSAGSPTYTTNEVEISSHMAGSLSFNSASYTISDNFELVLDNRLRRRMLFGSLYTKDPKPTGRRGVSLSLGVEYETDALPTALTADTQGDVAVTFTNGSRSLAITVHNAYLDDVAHPVETADILSQRAMFLGESDGTDDGLQLVIVNTQSDAVAA